MSLVTFDNILLLCNNIHDNEGILRNITRNSVLHYLSKNENKSLYNLTFDYFDCESPLKQHGNNNTDNLYFEAIIFNEGLILCDMSISHPTEESDNKLYKKIEIYFDHVNSYYEELVTYKIISCSSNSSERIELKTINFKKTFHFINFKIFDNNDGYIEIILHNAILSTDPKLSITEKIEIHQTSFHNPSIFKDKSLSEILSLLFSNDIL